VVNKFFALGIFGNGLFKITKCSPGYHHIHMAFISPCELRIEGPS